jgi:hypothetical protein
MFEVGKKYKRAYDDIIYECIFVGNNRALLRGRTGYEVSPFHNTKMWKEYKEPQKITLYLGFYTIQDGTLQDGRLYHFNQLFRDKKNIPQILNGDPLNGIHEIVYEEKLK